MREDHLYTLFFEFCIQLVAIVGTGQSIVEDGSITTQTSFIRPPVQSVPVNQFQELVGETYKYDRLYRLRSVYNGPYQYAPPDNQTKPKWYMDGDYENHYKYDANGNFTYLRRWGRIAGPPYNVLSVNKKMDEFVDYVYTGGTNLLTNFTEGSSIASNYAEDIDASSMQSGNYVYDASGRLTSDKMEGVKPKWDVNDMVVEVVNNNGPLSSGESTPNASSKKIRYRYDASGQRVQRLVFNFNATNGDFESEPAYVQSYVYGMGGELLGVYEQKYVEGELQENAELKEWPMYGAGRLGLAQPAGTVSHLGTLLPATDKYDRPVDKKRYELTDHLGNVRAVVSDLKLDDGSGSFLPDLKAYYNYYAFGMLQPHRWWEAESYRFGYNGVEKENDVTVKGGIAMADFRMYDARVGRWWGVDKIVKPWESPYAAFFNNPINFADPSGLNGTDGGSRHQPDAGEDMGWDNEAVSGPKRTPKKTDNSTPVNTGKSNPPVSATTPVANSSEVKSPAFDPSYGPLKGWSDFNNSYSGWGSLPILGATPGSGFSIQQVSRMTYSTLDNAGLFVGNLLGKRILKFEGSLRHINGDVAHPNEVYYGTVDTWANIWTSFLGGTIVNTDVQAVKAEVQAVKVEVQAVKAEVQVNKGVVARKVGDLAGGPLENAAQVSGRFKLEGGPKNATIYRADNRGNITSYATYDDNGMILKRVDVTGAPHNGVNTPHVIEYGRNTLPNGTVRVQSSGLGDPRPAIISEIP